MAPSLAAAQDALAPLKPADRTRIENLAASRDNGLKLAESGKPAELSAVKDLLALPALPLDEKTLTGKWRCRSIQLGGIFPLTTNPFYECRIVRERGGAVPREDHRRERGANRASRRSTSAACCSMAPTGQPATRCSHTAPTTTATRSASWSGSGPAACAWNFPSRAPSIRRGMKSSSLCGRARELEEQMPR